MIHFFKTVPKSIFLYAFLGTVLAIFTNEINRSQLNSTLPHQFGMIHTADEASYIVPPKNWVKTGEWKDNSIGLSAYYQRPPGYGGIYLLNFLLLNKSALLGMKILQIFLFFVSCFVFWKILNELKLPPKWQIATTAIYAFLPSYSGFIYFSITEGVTPFFMLWSIYELIHSNNKNTPTKGLIISNALLLIIRPQLAILPLIGILYFLVQKSYKTVGFIALAFVPISAWYLRTAIIAEEIPSIHPIYSATNNHLYRPTHAALTEIYRVWEYRSDVFHTHIGKAISGDSIQLKNIAEEIPSQYRREMIELLNEFSQLNAYRINHFSDKPINDYFKGEVEFISKTNALREKFIEENPIDFYFKTPFKSAVQFMNKSYMNLYIFQVTYRGNFMIEGLRILCWIIFSASVLLTFLIPFKIKWNSLEVALVVGIGLFLFYLVAFQRLNEERYIVPIMPLLLLLGAYSLFQFTAKNRFNQ